MQFEILNHEFVCSSLPTAMCHASTVLPVCENLVLCAWFGGTAEGEKDVNIWVNRRENGTWGTPVCISAGSEAHWNPVLQQVTDRVIRLYFKYGPVIAHWQTYFCESADGGKTWDQPRELVPGDVSGGRGPVRNKILKTQSGKMLAPGSTELCEWLAFVDVSEDDGTTWKRSASIPAVGLRVNAEKGETEEMYSRRGVIQPSLWEAPAGQIHMLLRSTEGFVCRSDSADDGEHWSDAVPTALPNNNSGLDLAQLPDGTLALVCNPVGENWGARTPISLFLSKDGNHFEKIMDLDTGAGEFSYPAVVCRNRELFITYTRKRENIAYWHMKISE